MILERTLIHPPHTPFFDLLEDGSTRRVERAEGLQSSSRPCRSASGISRARLGGPVYCDYLEPLIWRPKWEFPTIGGPNMYPKILGLLL